MGFLDSLSQWFKGGSDPESGASPKGASVPSGAAARCGESSGAPTDSNFTLGKEFLMTVADRNFLVKVVEVRTDSLRVSFPGVDYPVGGT